MSYVIQCGCGQQMTVEDEYVGKDVQCVACQKLLKVPPKPAEPGQIAMAETIGPAPSSQPGPTSAPAYSSGPVGGTNYYAGAMQPHRGTLMLVLGLLGLFCCGICGIFSWVMGNSDLKAMKEGRMDPSGEGLTNAGRIIGIIAVVLSVLSIIIYAAIAAIVLPTGIFE